MSRAEAMPLPERPSAAEALTIRAPQKRLALNLREVWQYRELLQLLVWRDTVVRYKQSVVGVGWALIRPITTMIVFSVVFGRLARLPSHDIPYPLFTFVALLPWNYFASCLGGTSASLVGGTSLMQKVYFPRLILPLSTLASGLVDFAVASCVLAAMMAYYWKSIHLTSGLLCLPLFLLLAMATGLAVGLWLSALMVKYRDVQHLMPFILQMWMYLSPVAYTSALVPRRWYLLYALNPLTGVFDGFRWALLGLQPPNGYAIGVSACVALLALHGGLYFFRKVERTCVDIV